MDKDRIKGAAKEAEGAVKETIGRRRARHDNRSRRRRREKGRPGTERHRRREGRVRGTPQVR